VEIRQGGLNGLDHIASAGVSEYLSGLFREPCVKGGDGLGGEFGDAAVELVLEFSGGVDEADSLAVCRDMVGVEGMETTATLVGGFAVKDGGGGAIAEEAEGNEHAGVVIDVKGGGGDLHGDYGDGMGWVRGEVAVGGAEGGDGRTATEPDEIAEVRVGA
jgi:hypothetical protein